MRRLRKDVLRLRGLKTCITTSLVKTRIIHFKMTWKVKTKYGNAVHLFKLGEDKTLCGRPGENYDTEEGRYTVTEFLKYHRACCLVCLKKARQSELLGHE